MNLFKRRTNRQSADITCIGNEMQYSESIIQSIDKYGKQYHSFYIESERDKWRLDEELEEKLIPIVTEYYETKREKLLKEIRTLVESEEN